MLKAIIFDLDNTLTDFMYMKNSAVKSAVDAMIDAGLKMDEKHALSKIFEIYSKEGIEYQKVFDEFLKNEIGYIDYKILSAGIVAYRKIREATLVTYPHVNMTLMQLMKRGLKMAVISDAPTREAWLRLCYLQLHYVFDCIVTFEDTGKRKPQPEPFLKVMERLNVKADECLMVGDWAERDIVGAKQLGMRTVFARYGDTFNTQNHGADFEINDIAELIDIVEKIKDGINKY